MLVYQTQHKFNTDQFIMSLIISNIALHFISKQEENAEIIFRQGPEKIEVTNKIENFVDALHAIYNSKASKAYGFFDAEPNTDEAPKFVEIMEDYLNQDKSFFDFGIDAAGLLTTELAKYDLAETGYLVICHYEYMGGRYIIAAVIPVTEHYSVDGDLNISAAKHLDTAKLQLAARIDLFDYQNHAEGNRYISFIKGRAGRKVSDFFLDFLSCKEGVNTKEQSLTLVQAVEDFVNVNQLDSQEKQQVRKDLLSYCKEQKESAQEVSIKELGEVINTDSSNDTGDFYKFCQEQSYPLEDSFPHDQAVINKVTKYSGYGNGISLSFERSHFGQDVVYNQANDSLTIYKVPPNLKSQLLALIEENNKQQIAENNDA